MIEIIEATLRETQKSNKKRTKRAQSRKEQLQALKTASAADLLAQIQMLLKLPMYKRTNFLRVRHAFGGSHL